MELFIKFISFSLFSAIFKMMTKGSWLMAQLECLHKRGSLQYFYENPSFWPVNIHQLPFDVSEVMWIPSSLIIKNVAGTGLFDDGMDAIMSEIEYNREVFGVHGVLPAEREVCQLPVQDLVQPTRPSSVNFPSNSPNPNNGTYFLLIHYVCV